MSGTYQCQEGLHNIHADYSIEGIDEGPANDIADVELDIDSGNDPEGPASDDAVEVDESAVTIVDNDDDTSLLLAPAEFASSASGSTVPDARSSTRWRISMYTLNAAESAVQYRFENSTYIPPKKQKS